MASTTQYGDPALADATNTSQQQDSSAASQHKRTYQACIPCRRRKVRCDLGPVDDPHEPPCVRCRRESKDCFFSATRRKRKLDGGEDELGDDDNVRTGDEYVALNGRKKGAKIGNSSQDFGHRRSTGSLSATSPLNGYNTSVGEGSYQQPELYSTDDTTGRGGGGEGGAGGGEDPDQEVHNEAAAALFQSPINIPGDALHLLLKASKENEHLQRRSTEEHGRRSTSQTVQGPTSAPGDYRSPPSQGVRNSRVPSYPSNIDPAITGKPTTHGRVASRLLSTENLRLWSRLRFVRAGWFTAREAVQYLDYFYEFINPLTPISLPPYRTDTAHSELLQDEPMLTVTLLTIASRYMKLEGPGAATRSFMVHERLWTYLQNTITRMFWGQEQFGGGFCGAGARKQSLMSGGKGSLRSLGTIESLLLLNEFHPRSMHFPPRDDEDDILVAVDEEIYDRPSDSDRPTNGDSALAGSWSEPALRSDRMCWSLIGTALLLAYEVGIFGRYSDGIRIQDARIKRQNLYPTERQRIERIERLLYIFHLQCSGRFGLPTMYPDQINRFNFSSLQQQDFPSVEVAMLPDAVDKTQQCWVDLMTLMKATNETFFSSKDQTARLVQSGEFVRHLDEMQPMLQSWYQGFKSLEVSRYARIILSIEYHYINLYINALALQAVLEQWTTKAQAKTAAEGPASPASSVASSFTTYHGKNEPYIKEVIDSSRTVLRHVVEDLLPTDYLKHAPVRTFFRIVSATMFLLKTFSVGGKAQEVQTSLHLLGATAKALRTSYVDDVHLCLRIADLLDGLLASIKPKFVRLPPRPMSTPELARRTHNYTPDSSQGGNNKNHQAFGQFGTYWSGMSGMDNTHMTGIPRNYNNPHDTSISIIPPISNTYNHPAAYSFANPNPATATYSPSHPQSTAMYSGTGNSTGANDNNSSFGAPPMDTGDDWVTLNVNNLLGGGGGDEGVGMQDGGQWFSAFGPETQDTFGVLGKLAGESGYGGGMGGF